MAVEEETVVDMVEEEEAAVVMIDAAIKIENGITQIRRPSSYEMVLTSGTMRATTSRQMRCARNLMANELDYFGNDKSAERQPEDLED